jgi:hypothetical protein
MQLQTIESNSVPNYRHLLRIPIGPKLSHAIQNEITTTTRTTIVNNAELSNSPVKTCNLHQKKKLSGKALTVDLKAR